MHYQTSTSATASFAPRRPGARLRALFALLALAGPAAAAASERTPFDQPLERQGFELITETRGVKVYKHRTSKVIRIAAEGILPAPPAEVRDVVLDYRGQEKKVDRVSESRVLRQANGWLVVYQRLNLPIISDRDFTLLVKWGQDNGTSWVAYDGASTMGPPPRDGIVRVTDHSGSWQLRPADNGRATFVRFQARIDLAGSLPRWMARSGAGKELPNLFANLCRLTHPKHRSRPCN